MTTTSFGSEIIKGGSYQIEGPELAVILFSLTGWTTSDIELIINRAYILIPVENFEAYIFTIQPNFLY